MAQILGNGKEGGVRRKKSRGEARRVGSSRWSCEAHNASLYVRLAGDVMAGRTQSPLSL